MPRIVVLVSGNGTNLQYLIDKVKSKELNVSISAVVSDRECFALKRAEMEGIPYFCLNRKEKNFGTNLLSLLNKYADFVVCAGFLSIIDPLIIQKFQYRIINLHPALLPAFGGKGMFGNNVHRAVLDYGCKITGCTVHFITDDIDGGPIILQYAIPVLDNDDEQSLAQRLSLFEHNILFEAVKLLCENRLKVEGRKVTILLT